MHAMTDQHKTTRDEEESLRRHDTSLDVDFGAAHAVSGIYRAANAVRAHVTNEVLRPYDLSWTGFVVLWAVWMRDGMETRRAAEAAAISKATLSGVVKTLEARGWIEKRRRSDNRRLVQLHLTDSGTELLEELYPKFNAIEEQLVAGLSSRSRKGMTRGLNEIVTAIEEAQAVPEPA